MAYETLVRSGWHGVLERLGGTEHHETEACRFRVELTAKFDGAAKLLACAIEAEVEAHLAAYRDLKLPNGRQGIVRQ